MSGQLAPPRTEQSTSPSSADYGGQEALDELLYRTCTARGIPIVIEDPAVTAKVARIVTERGDQR